MIAFQATLLWVLLGGAAAPAPVPRAQDGEVDRILLRFNQRREKARSEPQFRQLLLETRAELEKFMKENPKHKDEPRAAWHYVETYLTAQDLDVGLQMIGLYLKEHPRSEQAPTAQFAAGEILLQKENDAGAREAFQAFVKNYPQDDRAVYAKLYIAVSLANEKKFPEAETILQSVRKDYAGRKEAWGAAMQLAVLYHVQEKNQEARATLEEIIKECPEKEPVEIARRHLVEYLKLGRPAPGFSEKDISGADFSLEKHRGKVVVLYFFDSSNAASVTEASFLKKARDLAKGPDLQILGVSLDLDRRDLALFKTEAQIDWPLHCDGKGFDGKLARLYDVRGLPSLLVIDRKGKMRFFNIAGRDLRAAMFRLLEEK
jgi:TolA-binding protein/peroxiredoxin